MNVELFVILIIELFIVLHPSLHHWFILDMIFMIVKLSYTVAYDNSNEVICMFSNGRVHDVLTGSRYTRVIFQWMN